MNDLDALSELLYACVHGGASVGFVLPFGLVDARRFWVTSVMPDVAAGRRKLLVRRDANGTIAGAVQLDLATPPNQRHRAEVKKLLVHPLARRRGLARELMRELEEVAKAEGRTLLTLDTGTGSAAEPLYLSLGYIKVGEIPRYSRMPASEEMEPTTVMYKQL